MPLPTSLPDRVVSSVRSLSTRLAGFPSERAQRRLLLIALPVLVVGSVWAYRNADISLADLRLIPLVLAATVALPLVVAVNAMEYRTTGRAVGQDIPLRTAMRIAVLATVFNYLPGHGGALLRVQTLRSGGSAYRDAGGATLAAALTWLGVAAAIPGMWLLWTQPAFGLALLAAGASGLSLAILALMQAEPNAAKRNRLLVKLVFIEVASVASLALRYYLLLIAIRYSHQPALAAFTLSLASVLAAATGVMPGGLGIRELLATVLAPLAGLPLSIAFLITTLDRVLGLSGHALVAIPLLRQERATTDETEAVGDDLDPKGKPT